MRLKRVASRLHSSSVMILHHVWISHFPEVRTGVGRNWKSPCICQGGGRVQSQASDTFLCRLSSRFGQSPRQQSCQVSWDSREPCGPVARWTSQKCPVLGPFTPMVGAKRGPMAQRNRLRPQPESNYRSSMGPLKPMEGLCISSSTNIYLDTVPDAGERAKIKTRHCPGGVSILLCLCFPVY